MYVAVAEAPQAVAKMLSTSTLAKFPEITADDLVKTIDEFRLRYPYVASTLKCSPEAYIAIKDYFVTEEHEEMLRKAVYIENQKKKGTNKPYPEPKNYWGSIYGIDIKLDPDLAPGEYRFE